MYDVSPLHQTKKSGSVPEAGQIVAPSGENSRWHHIEGGVEGDLSVWQQI